MPTVSLTPFPGTAPVHPTSLKGDVMVVGRVLRAGFSLAAPINDIKYPSGGVEPRRRDALWESTCFEVFFGPVGEAAYWELNFSPSGDWNVYSFTGYREGMKAADTDIVSIEQPMWNGGILGARIAIRLPVEWTKKSLEAGVSAVLDHGRKHEKTYWSIAHAQEKPDFHWRGGFTMDLG